MTVKESTVCSLIQSFPVFLILAQNAQKCLKTPLVYKPPSPTHSPEYYEALDGLFQSLYSHSTHNTHGGGHGVHGGGHGAYGGSYGSHGSPEYSYHYPDTSSNCQYTYGKKWGGGTKPCYQYVYTTGNGYHTYGSALQGYSRLGLKKGNIYALNNATSNYAPGQVYNTKNRFQVVVKKTKIGKKRSRRHVGFFPQRGNQNGFLGQSFLQGQNIIRDGVNGFFHPNRQRPVKPTPQETIYVIETDLPINQNGRPMFIEQGGNVNFNGNSGVRPNQGGGVFLPNQGGFIPNQGNNEGFFPNQGNNGPQITEGAVNFGNNPQFPPFNGNQDNGYQDENGQNGETCDTVDGGLGNCISIYNCQKYLKLVQEARSEATQILRKAHCGFEGNNPKVCCPLPGIPTAPPQTTTTTTTTTTTPAPETPSGKTLGDFIDSLPDPPVCGVSNATFSRVVGGVNAKLGDFPWMALLGYKSRRGGTSWLCGGSLISSRHILTAAHCIHNHENDLYVIRLGELDLAREDEGATPVDVLIKEKIKHEQYSSTAFTNDIGILILDHDVQFTDLIRPICIPKDSELRSRSFEDYTPLIAGWGHTEFRGPSATHLQVLQLPVVSNEFCTQAYSAYKAQKIDERVLCAGYKKGGKDACQGDSGGPLMQPIWSPVELKTYFFQIGVVSYGKKCAEAGFPGVYSRITHFVPWIEQHVTGRSR